MMRSRAFLTVALACYLTAPSLILAAPRALHVADDAADDARVIAVKISAEVTVIEDGAGLFEGGIAVGDEVEGVYVYDASAPNLLPWTNMGRYRFSTAPCGITAQIGEFLFRTDPNRVAVEIRTGDDVWAVSATYDEFKIDSAHNLAAGNGISVDAMSIWLEEGYLEGELSRPLMGLLNADLPTSAPMLDDWPTRTLRISGPRQPSGTRRLAGVSLLTFAIEARLTSAVLIQDPLTILYVDHRAAGLGDGSSWQNAYPLLQDALAAAKAVDKPVEIRVAQGVYRPDQGADVTLGEREASFQLLNRTSLKGGYAGLRADDPNARDVDLYRTVLTGDLRCADRPGFLNRSDNSFHVVCAIETDETAVLDGFIVMGGSADGRPSDAEAPADLSEEREDHLLCGGGLYISSGSPLIVNCTFRDNLASKYGGALYATGNPFRIRDCTFVANRAVYAGGAVCDNCRMAMKRCLFQGNSASLGSAIYVCKSGGCLVNCTLADNRAHEGAVIDCSDPSAPCFAMRAVFNSILWSPGQRLQNNTGFYYSDVLGGSVSYRGNIDADPRFAAPGRWADLHDPSAEADPNDPNAIWIEGDYHLKSQAGRWDPNSHRWVQDDVTSPCIDAGDPNSDWTAEPWPNGERINIGAYGGTTQASMSLSFVGDPGDPNGDDPRGPLRIVLDKGAEWPDPQGGYDPSLPGYRIVGDIASVTMRSRTDDLPNRLILAIRTSPSMQPMLENFTFAAPCLQIVGEPFKGAGLACFTRANTTLPWQNAPNVNPSAYFTFQIVADEVRVTFLSPAVELLRTQCAVSWIDWYR